MGSLDPIGDEHVGVALFRRVAVGAEDDLLAVGRKHREAVEGVVKCDAHKPWAIDIDHVNEVVLMNARERDPKKAKETARIRNDYVFALIGGEKPTKFLESIGVKIG